uniref:non-specific serine/threonine protein kinase n=1 Tax=Laticauda laticaudata TaxID=8630 RepID=A0A8C5S4B1_LATLA
MDNYVIIKMIGEGAFGKIFLARKKEDNQQCVIKEINLTKMPGKEKESSQKEATLLAKMKHPNIVAFYTSLQEKNNLYIMMEYCDGGDLMKRINMQHGVLFDEDKVSFQNLGQIPQLIEDDTNTIDKKPWALLHISNFVSSKIAYFKRVSFVIP